MDREEARFLSDRNSDIGAEHKGNWSGAKMGWVAGYM